MSDPRFSPGDYCLWTTSLPGIPVVVLKPDMVDDRAQNQIGDQASIPILLVARKDVIWADPKELTEYEPVSAHHLRSIARGHEIVQNGYPDLEYWASALKAEEISKDDCVFVRSVTKTSKSTSDERAPKSNGNADNKQTSPRNIQTSTIDVVENSPLSIFDLTGDDKDNIRSVDGAINPKRKRVSEDLAAAKKTRVDEVRPDSKVDHTLTAQSEDAGNGTQPPLQSARTSHAEVRHTSHDTQAEKGDVAEENDWFERLSSANESSDSEEEEDDELESPPGSPPAPNNPWTKSKTAAEYRAVLNPDKVTLTIGGGQTSRKSTIPSRDLIFSQHTVDEWAMNDPKTKDKDKGYVIKNPTWAQLDPANFALIHDTVTHGDFRPRLIDYQSLELIPGKPLSEAERKEAFVLCTSAWKVASHMALAKIMAHLVAKVMALNPIPIEIFAKLLRVYFKEPLHAVSMDEDRNMRKVLIQQLEQAVPEILADPKLMAEIRDKKRCPEPLRELFSRYLDTDGSVSEIGGDFEEVK